MAKDNVPEEPELTKSIRMGKTSIIVIGIALVVAALFFGYLLYALWYQPPPDASGNIPDITVNLFGGSFSISAEIRLVLLVMVVGLIGSYIHTIVSFVNFAGNRKLVKSWLWYYITRPFAGPFLALIFYLLIRGGMLSTGTSSEEINQYGMLAVSGLAGLFSNRALEKLEEIFKDLFKTKDPTKLNDKLDNSESD